MTNQSNLTLPVKRINWQDTLVIRHQVLWPNKPIEFCHLPEDETAWHYGIEVDNQLVCVASIFIEDNNIDDTDSSDVNKTSARLRKFATLASQQGNGLGSAMLRHIMQDLTTHNIQRLWFDARLTATGFYQQFDFQTFGDTFYKQDVEYIKMQQFL